MAKRRTTALARRRTRSGPSRGFLQAKKSAVTARKRATAVRKKNSGRAGGLKMGASVVAGGALGGVANGLFGEFLGMEADLALGLILLTYGVTQNRSNPILMAAGIGACYARDYAEDMLVEGEFNIPFLNAAGGE